MKTKFEKIEREKKRVNLVCENTELDNVFSRENHRATKASDEKRGNVQMSEMYLERCLSTRLVFYFQY